MGVDYDGIGGIGIKVNKDIAEKLIRAGVFTQEDWEEDEGYCLDKLGIEWETAGSAYSGDEWNYLFVKGETLPEINAGVEPFIKKLSGYGIEIKESDLKVIADLHVW